MIDVQTLASTMPNISHATLLGQFLQPRAQGDISLSWFEVGVAATLLLINAIISLQLGLALQNGLRPVRSE